MKPNTTKMYNVTAKQIGQTLRNIRQLRGLSQEKVARALKVTFQQVQKYESGANRIATTRLMAFCWYMDITLSDFEKQLRKEWEKK